MRLIIVETYDMREFFNRPQPPYAILSHTWEEEEVLLADMADLSAARQKKGFLKIEHCCRQAKVDGHEWVWVDTCCIDKSSSAELSETINSMFWYYSDAMVCYAYLCDIDDLWFAASRDPSGIAAEIQKSRWFSRGWTLQEFIAPYYLTFYSSGWVPLVGKTDWRETLEQKICPNFTSVVEVPLGVLLKRESLAKIPVAIRLRWAGHRVTTRAEDIAYCLLGLLGVNMPFLYGEGHRAFFRLQEEVLRRAEDYSILAWATTIYRRNKYCDFLAVRPSWFSQASSQLDFRPWLEIMHRIPPPVFSSRGLTVKLPIKPISPQIIQTERVKHPFRYPKLESGDEGECQWYQVALPCLVEDAATRSWGAVALDCIDSRGNVQYGHPELVRVPNANTISSHEVLDLDNPWEIRTCYLKVSNESLPKNLYGGKIMGVGLKHGLYLDFKELELGFAKKPMGWQIAHQSIHHEPYPSTKFTLHNQSLGEVFGPITAHFSAQDMRVTILYPIQYAPADGGDVEQVTKGSAAYQDNNPNDADGEDRIEIGQETSSHFVREHHDICIDNKDARGPLRGKRIRMGVSGQLLSMTLCVDDTSDPNFDRDLVFLLSIS